MPERPVALTGSTESSHDELNLNRLMFIVASNRVPTTAVGWEKTVTIDHQGPIHIRCTAGRDNVVPHGIDNDVIVGLVNLYVQQGMPDDGRITVTVNQLLRACGLSKNGRVYREVRSSLTRLADTKYDFTKSWYDVERRAWLDEEGFRLILEHRFLTPPKEKSTQFQPETVIQLTLAHLLTRSIRAGHLRPLDLEFYASLSQPLVRTLYRLLREQSFTRGGQPVLTFTADLRAWATHLGLHDMRMDLVRRALRPAHDELIEKRFLTAVAYVGRGEAQQVTYQFTESLQPLPPTDLVGRLTQRGMPMSAATKLAGVHAREVIEHACRVFDANVSRGYPVQNPGGFLTSILRNPSAYPDVPAPAPVKSGRAKKEEHSGGAARMQEPEPLVTGPEDRQRTANFLLARAEHPEHRRKILTDLFVQGHITVEELTLIGRSEDPDALMMSWISRRAQQEQRD